MEFLKIESNTDIIDNLNLFINRDYDKHSMLRIMELYKLRDCVMFFLEEQEKLSPPPIDGKIYRSHSIYSCVLHSIDLLLYNFMNDESLVVLNGREPLKLTMGVCIKGLAHGKYNFPRRDDAIKEIRDLYINRNNEMIGSMILDFSVATFSALEMFLSEVYYLKAKKEKLAKDKKKYRGNVPANEKINTVLNLCMHATNPIAKEEREKFKKCIDVLRDIRNTIHTLGIYTKDKDVTYTIDGASVYLRKSKPVTTDDHRFNFLMCKEIVSVYRRISDILGTSQISYIEVII
ncbi:MULTISPECIES: hypothetical protein [Serratia]|uniref:hypothetical protein n=1 Tax=Serratia TaxID=613 RepID=UPI000EF4D69F|nr:MULTISPECIES: hypothetical protein [Serratia]AYM92571.1 hypothetical protein D9980_19475 [Serratia sp. 3ACOL1]CAI0996959.1 Uncharacterised protein [Serratia fonticola]CAI1190705.1 Uncharacterised protein [Serratia fonticola]